ncbi:RipA family octameric membrane protein [Prevotella melaninogenica]|uniref:Uncharacterized protein n=1 Tax=Prevotella melaninogenica TaxID=28132 RepID=A0A7D4JXI7_9BACT|nr:hypothetical protein [Prevotella melaninogenica]EFC72708.1 hypothetical protein HMPREF0660_01665 [Prevotella melaninogenica D18]QKH89273.1 hypothetical protein FIU21_10175 [Prevotella melaninogenica]
MKENKGGISKEDYINNFDEKKLEEAFQIALDTRKFEIELYWKRTGYFVLFIGAVFVGYYKVLPISGPSGSEKEWLLLLLSSLGFLLSLLWYMANRGSKFWQENWEAHIEDLSIKLRKPIFGIIKINEYTIYNPKQFNKSYPFSVSKVNQMVSLIITFSWLLILLKDLGVFLKFENNSSIVWDIAKVGVGVLDFILSYIILSSCRSFVTNVNIVESSDTSKNNKEKVYYFYNYDRTEIRQEDKLGVCNELQNITSFLRKICGIFKR